MARILKRTFLMGSALGSAALAHGLTLERSELHDLESVSQHYATVMAMKLAGRVSRSMMQRDLDNADFQQQELLKGLLAKNKDTECGTDRGYASILADPDPVSAFRGRHPLTRYQDYAYYVERIGEGHSNVVTADDVQFLAVTSGTSGKRHMLPMTSSIQGHFFLRGITSLFDTMFTTWPSAFGLQKTLKLTYMPRSHYTAAGVRLGPASSNPSDPSFRKTLSLVTTPWEAFQALPEQEGLYLHLLFALRDRNLGIIEGNFASLPYFAAAKLERDWRQLANDIEQGTISTDAAPTLSADSRQKLEAKMTPNPKRAAEIRRECEAGMQGVMLRLWPKLRVILACSTGSFVPYARALAENHAAGVPVFSPLYAATEGLLGLCLDPSAIGDGTEAEYTLVPSSMFFEFIPLDQSDEAQPQTLLASELRVPDRYELVVTTRAGLCRWRIGDVVQCVGYNGQSPIVRFCHRQGQVLNIRGEKLSEETVALSIQDALYEAASTALVSSGGSKKPAGAPFVAAERFRGAREGYYFGMGKHGLGYYVDDRALRASSRQAASNITDYASCESILLLQGSKATADDATSWTPWIGSWFSSPGSRDDVALGSHHHGAHYVVFVETAASGANGKGGKAPTTTGELQSQLLDAAMQQRSPVYQSFRAKGAIRELEVVPVRPGTFARLRERWLSQRGATPNQQKVPRVLHDANAAQFLASNRIR